MGTLFGSFTGTSSDAQSGGAGTGFKAGYANVQTPTTSAQADQTYGQAQDALSQQQNFANAVSAQNGLGNQSAVYNQLAGIANGTGANPAMAQLNQTTGQNVSNQAALMAGQRGSSSNAGLIARQAAQQGANTQQQAVGQGATLEANQQLNALNSMGTLATNQVNQQANATNAYTNATQGEQSQVLGGIAAQNNSLVGGQSSANSSNSTVANTTAQGQQGLFGGISSGVSSLGSLFAHGGMVQHFAGGGMALPTAPQMFADGGIASTPLNQSQGATSGPSSALGRMFAGPGQSMGGQGGSSGASALQSGTSGLLPLAVKGGQALMNYFNGLGQTAEGAADPTSFMSGSGVAGGGGLAGGAGDATGAAGGAAAGAGDAAATAGAADGAATAGGDALADVAALFAAKGGNIPHLKQVGGHVPGQASVKGDSLKNDTVPTMLSPGEIVIPRHITQGANAPAEAAKFVAKILAQQSKKRA